MYNCFIIQNHYYVAEQSIIDSRFVLLRPPPPDDLEVVLSIAVDREITFIGSFRCAMLDLLQKSGTLTLLLAAAIYLFS